MLKKLLPILIAVIGIGVGIGAGFFLRPNPETHSVSQTEVNLSAPSYTSENEMPLIAGEITEDLSYLELEDQFVVPVVKDGDMTSLVLITLALETKPSALQTVSDNMPRLRGALLQVMFDYANIGGFDGPFTNSSRLDKLRRNFFEVSQSIFGDDISDILILEITRQDIS